MLDTVASNLDCFVGVHAVVHHSLHHVGPGSMVDDTTVLKTYGCIHVLHYVAQLMLINHLAKNTNQCVVKHILEKETY